MASVLLIIFLSFITPVTITSLFLPFIIPKRFFSLTWRFSTTQFVRALFAVNLAAIASYFCSFLLVSLFTKIAATIASSLLFWFCFNLLYSSAVVVFPKIFTSLYTAFYLLRDRYTLFLPFDIQKDVKESFNSVTLSGDQFLKGVNFPQIFQNVNLPKEWLDFLPLDNYLNQVRKNLTISHETQQYVNTVNIALNRFLTIVQVENIFNITRLPPELTDSLHNVTGAIHHLGENLNLTLLLKGDIFPESPLNQFGSSLQATIESTDLKRLYNATVLSTASELNIHSSEKLEFLALLNDPYEFVLSRDNPTMGLPFRIAAPVYTALVRQYLLFALLVLCVVFPLLFVLRAALQDGFLWMLTRRYKFMIPFAQRSASGWMCVAAISGLAVVILEAFLLCCAFYYLLFSNSYSDLPIKTFLIFFALKGAPLRTASHMRIAEGVAEYDILKGKESKLWKGIAASALFNGMFSVWWLYSSSVFLLSPPTGLRFWAAILADILIVGFSIAWGRRICRRVVEKEQGWIEEQKRKQA